MRVEYEVRWIEDGAVFVLDRPAKLNSLTRSILDGLAGCLDQLEAQGHRVLVITGRGEKAFCAGTDLAEMQSLPMDARLAKNDLARDLFVRLSRSQVVSVAAINGLALGGGLELAMASTFRIAAPHSTFGLPEVKLSLLPAYAGTQFLPLIVGRARAEELMLTGRTIALEEALSIGLIHRSYAAADLEAAGIAFAREVSAQSPGAVAAIRACLDASGAALNVEGVAEEGRQVRAIFPSPDAEAGVARFLAKREKSAIRS